MPKRVSLEARIALLDRGLADLERRVHAIEAGRAGAEAAPTTTSAPASVVLRPSSEPAAATGNVALVGRTLVVLSGAYLFRALTDSGQLPPAGGVAAGLVYALLWLGRSDRAAARGARRSAAFHGIAAAVIAYPLIWETTARFGVLDAGVAAALLWTFCVSGLAVARRHGMAGIAWLNVLLSVASGLSLLVATRQLLPFALGLLALALTVEALAFGGEWLALRWPAALGVDLALLAAFMLVDRPGGLPDGYAPLPPAWLIAAGLALAALYLGSIAVRTLLRERPVTPFEATQAAAVLLVGFRGAASLNARMGGSSVGLGVFSLVFGIFAYAAAFAFVERRLGHARTFYFHSTLALVLTLLGSRMVLEAGSQALLWSVLALAAAWLGGRFDRVTLRAHGALYLLAAAVVAGLAAGASTALLGSASLPPRPLAPAAVLVAGVAVGVYGLLVATRRQAEVSWHHLLPQAAVAALVAWGAAGLAARLLVAAVNTPPSLALDPARVATARTAVVAALALALAWTGRHWARRELIWLVYPVLALGSLHLLLEDLRYGRPLTLFVSFALYGGALFACPKLLRDDAPTVVGA
jgi:hypothetical protein